MAAALGFKCECLSKKNPSMYGKDKGHPMKNKKTKGNNASKNLPGHRLRR
jgi:hypothetical protein